MIQPKIESVFHPSDFSAASEVAFVHALKIALVSGAMLNMMHVASGDDFESSDFPGVRATLERWRLLPKGSPQSAVVALGMGVTKVIASSNKPVKACLDFLLTHPADLIVLAVRQHEGRMRWLEKRVGEPIARAAGQATLFIPEGVQGFVSRKDGAIALRNILIPIAHKPPAQPAVDAVARMISNLRLASGVVTLLHVGPAAEAPHLRTPDVPGWTWSQQAQEGEATEIILQTARTLGADLIAMTTDGPDGFLDALRGSTSQRVLREAQRPVASLPVGASLG